MKLSLGRPIDNTGRLEKEVRVYDFLDGLGVTYERVDHAPAMTMEACEDIDKVLGTAMCKNLLLCNRQKTAFYLLLMPGDKIFQTKELSSQLGVSRLSFAPAEPMEEYLDITPGSLSVLGLINDRNMQVQLIIDASVLDSEYLGVHPCINTSSLKIKTDDLLKIILPATKHTPMLRKTQVFSLFSSPRAITTTKPRARSSSSLIMRAFISKTVNGALT